MEFITLILNIKSNYVLVGNDKDRYSASILADDKENLEVRTLALQTNLNTLTRQLLASQTAQVGNRG